MHFVFATQGIKSQVDMFVNDLQAQFFKWPMKDVKTGKEIDAVVQGALRPIQLWMYVFPEESLDEVLNTFEMDKYRGNKMFQPQAFAIRKAMGLKKVPESDPSIPRRMIRKAGVDIMPIGIKKDKYGEFNNSGRAHELL